MAKLVFNARTVEPATMGAMLPISGPEGHAVVITASEIKQAKSGVNNGFLELMLTIIEGEHRGESGAYRLNLYHTNEKTVEIAYRQLSAVCHVVNVFDVADTQQFHNIPFRAVVGYQKRAADWKEGDPEYTEVKGVLHADGSQPGKSKGAAGAPAGPAPSAPPVPEQPAPAWGAGNNAAAGGATNAPPWGAPATGAAETTPPWAQPK